MMLCVSRTMCALSALPKIATFSKVLLYVVELLYESPRLLSSSTADKLVSDQLLVFSRKKAMQHTYFCTV